MAWVNAESSLGVILMLSRRLFVTALGAGALSLSQFDVAEAAGPTIYDAAAFDAAVKSGKPVLLDIWASWCPVCKVQEPILTDLLKQNRFEAFSFFQADFDTEKALLRTYGIRQQSTLVLIKDGREVARSVGDTDRNSIEAMLAKAV